MSLFVWYLVISGFIVFFTTLRRRPLQQQPYDVRKSPNKNCPRQGVHTDKLSHRVGARLSFVAVVKFYEFHTAEKRIEIKADRTEQIHVRPIFLVRSSSPLVGFCRLRFMKPMSRVLGKGNTFPMNFKSGKFRNLFICKQ